jgi:precorrin-8X/cobalt-precorrin-8 methylmutase
VFDRVVIVDWSASSVPKAGKDSIWIAVLDTAPGTCTVENPRTRARAEARLLEVASLPGHALIGFDFPFGYPSGFAARLGLAGEPWRATWALLAESLVDDHRNRSNRWEVAATLNHRLGSPHFWGVPSGRASEWLTVRRPVEQLPRWRLAEQRLREAKRYPFSVWQLCGAGSVGSQALTGIPVVHRLRNHPLLRHRSAVWPFETGLGLADTHTNDTVDVVFAEVWPSAVEFDHVDHPVKDARQVIALAHHLANAPIAAPTLTADEQRVVIAEEGWVLGVP